MDTLLFLLPVGNMPDPAAGTLQKKSAANATKHQIASSK